jgi:uncharacterized protein YxjI
MKSMRYKLTRELWSREHHYPIRDADDVERYIVDCQSFAPGDKLSFQDSHGQELASIREKVLSLKLVYAVYRDGKLFAEIVKDFSLFKDSFTVDVPGPNDYSVKGDFWNHEYDFIRSGKPVARVSKGFCTEEDCYGVEITEDEDDVVILATAVVLELIMHEQV